MSSVLYLAYISLTSVWNLLHLVTVNFASILCLIFSPFFFPTSTLSQYCFHLISSQTKHLALIIYLFVSFLVFKYTFLYSTFLSKLSWKHSQYSLFVIFHTFVCCCTCVFVYIRLRSGQCTSNITGHSSCYVYLCIFFSGTHPWQFYFYPTEKRSYPPASVKVKFLSIIFYFSSHFLYSFSSPM